MTKDEIAALEPWQQRVVEEREQLHERAMKLFVFIGKQGLRPTLPEEDRQLLTEQLVYMSMYNDVLDKRIGRFTKPEQPKGEAS